LAQENKGDMKDGIVGGGILKRIKFDAKTEW